jgi:xylulokinase
MDGNYVIGADIGTTGAKVALFDEQGALAAEHYEELALAYPRPGWVEQNPNDFYAATVRGIRTCLEQSRLPAGRVAALALDGQMAGVCSVDAAWGTPTLYDSWLDTRCAPYIEVMKEHEAAIITYTGGPVGFAHGPKILWWKHERPEVFKRIARFVQPAGYVAGRLAGLSGADAFIDYTYLFFSGFSDTLRRAWLPELCQRFDVPIEVLPRIVNPWDIVGRVTPAAAADCGLLPGTPVAAGMGDQAAGALGAGIVEPGMLYDVAGTASLLGLCVDSYAPDVAHRTLYTMPSVVQGLYHPLAYINGGGLNLRWFRDALAAPEKELADAGGEKFYDLFDRLAEGVCAGSDSLLFLPHLAGRQCPNDPAVRGLWAGFTWAHGKPHLYRSLLESVAYEYATYLRIERELLPGARFTEARVLGGGSSSEVWNQIKADVLGVPYVGLNRSEFAVMGAAMVAGHAVGLFPDLKATARDWVQPVSRIEPRPEYHEFYGRIVDLYSGLFDALRATYAGLAALPPPPSQISPGDCPP